MHRNADVERDEKLKTLVTGWGTAWVREMAAE